MAASETPPLDPPTPSAPVPCTAGWDDNPCTALAVPGCELDGQPACRGCYENERDYWVTDEDET